MRPFTIHVIAEVFDKLWNLVRANRAVLAATDLNVSWPPITGIRTDSIQRNAVQVEKLLGAKTKPPIWMQEILNHLNDSIKLF